MTKSPQFDKRRLGDFEILRELGRGGMGIVYEARQISLNRKVALKVLGTSLGMTSKAVLRFRKEAEAAAKLHHTNIVPIYATGQHEDTHFYAMELIEGPSLNHVIHQMQASGSDGRPGAGRRPPSEAEATRARNLPDDVATGETTASAIPAWVAQTLCPESSAATSASNVSDSSSTLTPGDDYFDTVAKIIADVADALEHAHSHGVIHRDMKPSNLLLSSDGRLSINDFGLARMLEQPGMTMTGEFMGSPLYMSPEQIAAGRVALDHRTDIYSLGATLYELLTLQPPFPGERRDQIIGQILHKEPKPPRRISAKIPVDLETICLKAMEKDPDRRYQTAGQMAEDLRRFVNRFAISAKRAGVIGRTSKWVRRHPAVAASLLIALAAVATAGGLAYRQRFVERQLSLVQLDRAKESALLHAMSGDFARAESAIREAEMHGASAGWVRMLRGQVAIHQLQPSAAVEHLNQAVRLLPESVAANAMLSLALQQDGRWDQSFMTLQQFETLTPKTAEDYLFLGWAQSSIADASAGLPALDEAVRLRPGSPMVRVVRAKVRAFSAVDSGDSELIGLALADAITAKGMLPDSVAALEAHLYAHLVAINHYDENHDDARRSAALEVAQRDVQELGRFSGRPGAHFQRAKYFEYLGREQDVLNEWRVASTGEFASDEVFRQYAFALYRNRDYDKALEVADQLCTRSNSGQGELTRAWILLLIGRPNAQAMAMKSYRAALVNEESTVLKAWYQAIPRLAGYRKTALDDCQDLDAQLTHLPGRMRVWYQAALAYICERMSAEELLAQADHRRTRECETFFLAGVWSLGFGDRDQAIKHFQRAVQTRVFEYWDWDWSRLLVEKLRQDPSWPPWIPVADDAKSTTRPSSTSRSDE